MMDELARYKLHLSVHLKVKHNLGIIDDAIAITPEDIAYALKFTSDRRSAAMRGSTHDIEFYGRSEKRDSNTGRRLKKLRKHVR